MRRAAILVFAAVVTASIAASQPIRADAPSPPQDYRDTVFVPVVVTLRPAPPLIVDPQPRAPDPTLAPRPQPTAPIIVAPVATPRASSNPTVAQAQAWALATLGPTQYACLANIVKHEDGTWSPTRTAPDGAYGIPQALPGTKMAIAGSDWRTDRITQLRWMIFDYIPGRYGTPCGAWSFWQANGWY